MLDITKVHICIYNDYNNLITYIVQICIDVCYVRQSAGQTNVMQKSVSFVKIRQLAVQHFQAAQHVSQAG